MYENENKKGNNKEIWGCIGIVGAAVVTGVFGLIIALPTLIPLFSPTPTPITSSDQISTLITFTATPTINPEQTQNGFPATQVGPFWAWRENFGTTTLALNILWEGDCQANIEVIADDERYLASMITDTNDPLYLEGKVPFEGTVGTTCNYLVDSARVIKPSRYFSILSTKYGVHLPDEPPHEWCYQDADKTWRPCK